MSKPHELRPAELNPAEPSPDNSGRKGPSLALLYGLVALALAVALGVAALIVLPFYLRR